MARSVFIRAMHPKTEISPDPTTIRKVLDSGWAGQLKIHGHRAQIHLPADDSEEVVVYNRQGKPHKKFLSPSMVKELRRLFRPKQGWTVIDSEWLKPKEKLYLFDILRLDGRMLSDLTYAERWKLLPRDYLSPHLATLPLYREVNRCLQVLAKADEDIEGLVFKSLSARGFSDTSIVRCRKRPSI